MKKVVFLFIISGIISFGVFAMDNNDPVVRHGEILRQQREARQQANREQREQARQEGRYVRRNLKPTLELYEPNRGEGAYPVDPNEDL